MLSARCLLLHLSDKIVPVVTVNYNYSVPVDVSFMTTRKDRPVVHIQQIAVHTFLCRLPGSGTGAIVYCVVVCSRIINTQQYFRIF